MGSDERLLENSNDGGDPSGEYARLLSRYLDRLNNGELVDPDEILSDHPDLGERLISGLEAFLDITPDDGFTPPLGTLGDYTLRRQIGRGGMGTVYDAWQNSMERRVALKVLPRALAADTRAATRFIREAQIAGKLDHPNVVHVHATGVDEQVPYYAMEFVEGETLAQILAKLKEAEPESETPFGPKDQGDYFVRLGRAFADVADGLQHAHSKGVTHRDIKPSNLILDTDGRLRILDFGLARLEGQESLTLSGDFVGTPLYMSPEQAKRKKIPVDHRTDVYSLGATMYEAICGRPPFRGKDHADTLSQIIDRDPVDPRKVNPRVPKDLETIVLKCLRKDSGDRYGTAEALGQDLRRFVRGDPVEARPEGGVTRTLRRIHRYRWRAIFGAVAMSVGILAALLALRVASIERQRAAESFQQGIHASLLKIYRARLLLEERSDFYVDVDGERRLRWARHPFLTKGREIVDEALEDLTALQTSTREPETYYFAASGHLLALRYDEARAVLADGIARFPGFYPLRVLNDLASGRPVASRGKAEAPWASKWRAAVAAQERREWAEAVAAYDDLLAYVDPIEEPYVGATLQWEIERGIARLEAGDHDMAVLDFAGLWRACDGCLEATLFLGKAFYLRGDVETTERLLRELHARSLTETKPRIASLVSSLYKSLGDRESVEQWSPDRSAEERALRQRAQTLWRNRRCREYDEVSRAILDISPDDFWILMRRGYALVFLVDGRAGPERERQVKELLAVAERGATLYPEELAFPALLARGNLVQGDPEQAIAAAQHAWTLAQRAKRGGTLALDALGAVYLELGRTREAETRLRRAFDIEDKPCKRGSLLAVALERLGRAQEAEDILNDAIDSCPDSSLRHARLAELFLRQGRFEEVVAVCSKADGLFPANNSLAESHAEALLSLSRGQEALRVVEAGIESIHDRPRLHHVHGLILEHLGELDAARRAFQHAVELAGSYPDSEERIAALDSER